MKKAAMVGYRGLRVETKEENAMQFSGRRRLRRLRRH